MAEFKHIVRIVNTDLKGEKQLLYGLTKIKGVSIMYANAACRLAGINPQKKVGNLEEAEVAKLDKIIAQPGENGMPTWMLNRRFDPESGEDAHLLGGDIKFTTEQDIKKMKKIKSVKGIRHALRLTVRGQKTKSNFRKNKGKVSGVKKKKK